MKSRRISDKSQLRRYSKLCRMYKRYMTIFDHNYINNMKSYKFVFERYKLYSSKYCNLWSIVNKEIFEEIVSKWKNYTLMNYTLMKHVVSDNTTTKSQCKPD